MREGLVLQTMETLFESIHSRSQSRFSVMVSFIELYQGKVRDLGLPVAQADEISKTEIK